MKNAGEMSTQRTVDKARFPVVTRQNGSLKFHPETLQTVLTKTKKYHQYKLIPVAIFCRTFTPKPELFSNVLLHYFRFQKEWLVDDKLYAEIENDNYFKFSDNDSTGIYTYPTLFACNRKGFNILLHLHFNQRDQQRDKDPLENLLLLFCSRIVEINLSDLKFSIFESAINLVTSNLLKDLCPDIALVTRGHQEDTFPPNQEKYNLDGFHKINFIFVKMDWATFRHNLNKKIMPPEMKNFITNLAHGMANDFSVGRTPPSLGELLIYFKKCFDSQMSQTASKKHIEGNPSVGPRTNGNEILEEVAEGLFTPMRNKILEGLQNGSGEIYKILVSGNYEVDQSKILKRYHPIVRALQLNTVSIQVFQKFIQDKFREESAQLKLLVKVLKGIHKGFVENVLEEGKLAKNIIEGMPNQVLNEESYSPFIQKIVRMLPRFFKHEKNCQLIMGCAIFTKCVDKAKLWYDSLFQVALSKQTFSRETFKVIHVEVCKRGIAAIETAIGLLPNKMGGGVLEIYKNEDYFHDEFLTNREYNLDNLESSCKTIKYFVKGIKGQYDLQMQKDLKSNTVITSKDLEDIHQSALSKAEQNFEENIKTSEYSVEDFNEHVKVLRYRINQAFEGYKVRHARFVSTPAPSVATVKTLNQPVSLLATSDEPAVSPPILKQALLAIQFTLDKLVCKVIFEGATDAPEFKFSVELAVALLEDGRLLFGDSYEEFSQKNVALSANTKLFKIRDCFLSNYGDWSEILEIGNSRRRINEVFLLALILSDLKAKIEVKYRASIEKVVTTIPNWLATINRSKIEAAFSVTGFENVDFIPEILAVTCSTSQGSNVLVLSENSEVIEIAIFSLKNSIEFYESFFSSDRDKVKSWLETGLKNILSNIQQIRVAINYENSKWKTVFEKVIPLEHRSNIVFGEVLSGAMNYCKNGTVDVCGSHGSSKIIVFGELEDGNLMKADVKNENNAKVFVSRMKQRGSVKYYEERSNKLFLVGTLILQRPKSSRELITYFSIENGNLKLARVEGIKSPTICEFCNKSSSVNAKVLDDECFNFYPAIGEICEEMGDFIRELIHEKCPNLDGNAKDKLKLKCAFLKSAFENGELKFKSALAQNLFLKEIDEVGKLVQNKNTSLDEIKKKINVLDKFEAKYFNKK